MLHWFFRIFAAIVVWVIVALLVSFVGGLLHTVGQAQITYFGDFLVRSAGLIGFLAGACYLIWGPVPQRFSRP